MQFWGFFVFYSAVCIFITSVIISFPQNVTNIPRFLMHSHIYLFV